jgi:trans-aconitate 2-methyltransferase
MSSAAAQQAPKGTAPDWEASRYLAFERERTRPARDLLAQVPPELQPESVVDLGCGPGNSTALLAERYPEAHITGIDSSPNMLEKARAALPDVTFQLGDLRTYSPPAEDAQVDLYYSNATFQWLSVDERIPAIRRYLDLLPPGGCFAVQVPNNFNEPSHKMMREVAIQEPFRQQYGTDIPGNRGFPTPSELYDAFKPCCQTVDIWHTVYEHKLASHQAIVDWVATTGLRPYMEPLVDERQREEFVGRYLELLRPKYPTLVDGGVLLRFPRLFVVMTK